MSSALAAALRVSPRRQTGALDPAPEAFGQIAAGVALLLVGSSSALALHNGLRPNVPILVAIMFAIALWAGFKARVTRYNLLPRVMVFIYALPFSVLLGFLFDPKFVWVFTPNGYQIGLRPEINSIILMTGLAGLCGITAGFHFVAAFSRSSDETHAPSSTLTLGQPMYGLFVAGAVMLSKLSASPESLLQSTYSGKREAAKAATINFPAAYLVSYVVFVLLWLDIERERDRKAKLFKIAAFAFGVIYVIVVLQILRGDRESSGLVAALVALYLTAPGLNRLRPTRARMAKRVRRLALPLFTLVIVFVALGKARETVADVTSHLTLKQAIKFGWSYNTWTAVLWTNLGMAWQYDEGLIKYRLGGTYKGYLLSLPPGVISKIYGYQRPEEGWQGIAYDDPAHVSAGGLHAAVVPFKNFGAVGVMGVLFIYGALIGLAERAAGSLKFFPRLLWGSVFCASFIWFWYGDMPIIRALMAAVLLAGAYRLATLPHALFNPQPEPRPS